MNNQALETGRITDAETAKEVIAQFEVGVPALNKPARVHGNQLTPLVDRDTDVTAGVFATQPATEQGTYLGFTVVNVSEMLSDSEVMFGSLRVVHLLMTDTNTFTESALGRTITVKYHPYFQVQGTTVQPLTVHDNHSLEYLETNEKAAKITTLVDEIVFNDQLDQKSKIERVAQILTKWSKELLDDELLLFNTLSYIHSLGFLAGAQCASEYLMQEQDDHFAFTQLTAPNFFIFQNILGFELATKKQLKNGKIRTSPKNCLYLSVAHPEYGMVLVPFQDVTLL